jgi:hypothetical protein
VTSVRDGLADLRDREHQDGWGTMTCPARTCDLYRVVQQRSRPGDDDAPARVCVRVEQVGLVRDDCPFGEAHTRTQVGPDEDGSVIDEVVDRTDGRKPGDSEDETADRHAGQSAERFVSSQLAEPARPVHHAYMASR